MKRTLLYLFLGLFIYLIVSPNVQMVEEAEVRVPVRDATIAATNDDLLVEVSDSQAKICIDPYRGGSDVGVTSVGDLSEKELNLQLAKAIGEKLELAGYQVVYTREDDSIESYDSEELSSQARLAIAKSLDADYLISIQMSEDSNSLFRGFSLFTQPDENVTALAKAMAAELSAISFTQFEGIDNDHYANFPILSDRSLPSIIINFGYLTNSQDYEKLADPEYQSKIGAAITEAFLDTID